MCKVDWCNNKPVWNNYCRMHYDQIRKYGCITNDKPNGYRNEYISWCFSETAVLNILDKKGNVIAASLIDKEDIDKLSKYSFRYDRGHYIKCANKGKTNYLHRIVMNYNGDLEIDHINRNKLDNRKCNLRIVDRKTNANNRARKETCYITKVNRDIKKKYKVTIMHKYIGYYETLEEAIYARNKILNKYFNKEAYRGLF